MTASRDPDRLIRAFLDEGLDELPEPVYDAVRDRIEKTRQRTFIGPWRTPDVNNTMKYGLAAVAVIVAIIGFRSLAAGPTPASSPSGEPSATASATASAPATAFDDVLNAFLAARVAGAGAEQYLGNEQDVPLLYVTTSGAPYDRAEFEPIVGIEWPYGLTAFKVRLVAGETEVEQLFFAGPDGTQLSYDPDGFGTDIPPTTENGQPLARPFEYFDGSVTLQAAHPWIFPAPNTYLTPFGQLIPEGPGVPPTTDGGQRHNGWDRLFLIDDPALGGAGCQRGPLSVDAAALAQSIRSDPDLGATAPVAVSVGGAEALMMDLVIPAGTTISAAANEQGDFCADGLLNPVFDQDQTYFDNGVATGRATGDWMRLYLFDVPKGSSMWILAMAIIAPESRFERAVQAAAPVVDSVEFHVP